MFDLSRADLASSGSSRAGKLAFLPAPENADLGVLGDESADLESVSDTVARVHTIVNLAPPPTRRGSMVTPSLRRYPKNGYAILTRAEAVWGGQIGRQL
jgi:hypothetical protein